MEHKWRLIVIQQLLENIIKKCWSLYKEKERKKEEENQFCHHFRKIPRKGYNLQNCWSSLLFNNICQITNTKKVTSTLR